MKYWFMRQIWRVRQAQALYSLFYGTLVVSALYAIYLPHLRDLGIAGIGVFATVLLAIFLAGGYIYDKYLRMWEQEQRVITERNPYAKWLMTEKERLLMARDLYVMERDQAVTRAFTDFLHRQGADTSDLENICQEGESWIRRAREWVSRGAMNSE